MKRLASAMVLMLAMGTAMAEPAAGTIWKEPKSGMEFVWIPSGCFDMGSNSGETFEQPVHKVCLKGFWLGKDEVTQEQYQQLVGTNPSDFKGPDRPVDSVSWDDANSYAEEMAYRTGLQMHLPSEAEWEYACRAGGLHKLYCGDGGALGLAWFGTNSEHQTHPVGSLRPNAWGLYDMSGNVWEWVQDCWNLDYKDAPADGSAWTTGNCERRVARGGAWDIRQPTLVRAAKRGRGDRQYRLNVVGFRLAITPKP